MSSGAIPSGRGDVVLPLVSFLQRHFLIAALIENHRAVDTAMQRCVAELKNIDPTTPGADWESFEAVFTEMHPEFADNLRRDFPQLTRNDIRLCALISMDLDNKQIASLLHIQPESVKKRMQRLRSRLSLPPAAPLRDFLTRY